jgi:holo-[acyl-carrier protein] synthase
MAFAGIGVDMLEIERMEHALATNPHFIERVFTPEERAYCDRCARPAEHYAARFAAHEAILKALGCGFGNVVGLLDASVGRSESGRPVAVLKGRAAEIAAELGVREIALSLTHTHDLAVANAVCVTDEVRPKQEEKPDPAAELAASFKEARSVIDELERLQNTYITQETQTSQEV